MDRRNFFRKALNNGGKAVVKHAQKKVNQAAANWIRPPFAIDELEFLLACTRCNNCIEACPHDVIFSLSAKTGAKTVGTPALDLLNKGCHLCEDWPCVTACEPKALLLPAENTEADTETQNITPKLAQASIDEPLCLPYSGPECGACFSSCPIPGALEINMFKPLINKALCTGCGLCRESCITEPKAIKITSLFSK